MQEFKIICLLVLSALLLGESDMFTPKMVTGCVLAIVGFGAYSHCKLHAIKARAASQPTGGGTDETQPLKSGPGAA